VKARFVDPAPPSKEFIGKDGMTRIFLPSFLEDNRFLAEGDPNYKKRLLSLPEKEQKALLYGDWNIFDGQYFSEFSTSKHVCEPFEIPHGWRKWRTVDYGLDRLACLWIAVSPDGHAYVYREFCASDLPIKEAADAILSHTPKNEEIYATLAPPDLFSRSQESGKSKASLFASYGVPFTKCSNNREAGWLSVKDLLRERNGAPSLSLFTHCTELIRCLPALQIDKRRPSDCATEPHDITHAPDALRGFAVSFARPAPAKDTVIGRPWSADMWEDYFAADEEGRQYLKRKYGEPL
jgi:phage terminase large subunit